MPPQVAHLWSLSVEEQFYLVWPFLILFGPKRSLVPICCLAFCCGTLHQLTTGGLEDRSPWISVSPLSALPALSAGAILAWSIRSSGRDASARLVRFACWIGLVLGLSACIHFILTAGDLPIRQAGPLVRPAMAVFFMGLVGKVVLVPASASLRSLDRRWLVRLGVVSYGIYIIHLLVPWGLGQVWIHFPRHSATAFLLHAVITYFLAVLSHRFLETPFNRLKSRFPYVARNEPEPQSA